MSLPKETSVPDHVDEHDVCSETKPLTLQEILSILALPEDAGDAKSLVQGGLPGLPEWAWHL